MLKPLSSRKFKTAPGNFAIVASRYNARYVDGMIRGARHVFEEAGVGPVEIVRVPGAFEIPLAATVLARRRWPRLSAIVALGVIIRGATAHANHIGEAVTQALLSIQLETEIPVVHEVLLLENTEQARERCLDARFNRGHEAAQTALAMAELLTGLLKRRGSDE